MREKSSLDRVTVVNLEEIIQNKQDKKERDRIKEFNEKALKCPNSFWKKEELKVSIFWCKEINKGCHISRCPKLKINKSL